MGSFSVRSSSQFAPTSDMQLPVLSGTRRWRARLSPRKHSVLTPSPSVIGSASSVGRHKLIRRRNLSHRVGGSPLGPGHGCANSPPSSSSGQGGKPQNPSYDSGFCPAATHAAQGACPSGQAVRIGSCNTPEVPLPQDLSTRRSNASPTQAFLNACSGGRADQIRRTRIASGVSAPAKSKRRKLGSQPPAAPSPQLLAKIAMKFPHLRQHPKGDG